MVNMEKGNYLSSVLRSKRTVFSTKDLALLWREANTGATRVRLNYYAEKGDLYRVRRGLYAKSKDYDPYDLATRILTPSYISFETVLVREGNIFQFYEPIFLASYTTRDLRIDGQSYRFRKIKDEILLNESGVRTVNEISTATRERALLDTLYLQPDYYFDNLDTVDWENAFEILPIYHSEALARRLTTLYRRTKGETNDD